MVTEQQQQQPLCGFEGNPDLYGLGLRLAFYIQAIPSTLAMMALYRETIYIWSSSIAFVLATFIVVVRDTIQNTLHAPDAAIITWLLSFQLARLTPIAWGIENYGLNPINQALLYLHTGVLLAILSYFAYFWHVGLDKMPHTACDEYAFVFVKVDLRGGFRTFNKVWFTLILALTGLVMLVSLLAALFVWLKRVEGEQQQMVSVDNKNENATPKVSGTRTRLVTGFWLIILTAGLVPSIELQIKWNEIRGVQKLDSPGQLIPLLLSLGQLVHVVYSMMRGKDSMSKHLAEETTNLEREVPACPEKLADAAPVTTPSSTGYDLEEAERGEGGLAIVDSTGQKSRHEAKMEAEAGEQPGDQVEVKYETPPLSVREDRELEEEVELARRWMAEVADRTS